MKVKVKNTLFYGARTDGRTIAAGEEVEIDDETAKNWIKSGQCERVEKATAKPKGKAAE